MFDIIKRGLLTGVGLAILTKEKAQELAKELVKKGKISEAEGKELVDELLKKSAQANKDLEAKVEDFVRKAVAKLNVATKDDVAELAAKIEGLEKEGTKQGK